MVNWVVAQQPLVFWLIRRAGLRQKTVVVDSGTSLTFWVPADKAADADKTKTHLIKKRKPSVVLVHGFAAEGIVTWQFQVGSLTKDYDVYVPDLLFFGGSKTTSTDRSPEFQAQCLGKALGVLGVQSCTLVGFSYGGMVAFKLAEKMPELVEAMVVSGSVRAMTDSISEETMKRLGFSSSKELLLPESVRGLKALLTVATHKKLWFPKFLYRDFLEVMFDNRKERSELLRRLVVSNELDSGSKSLPSFPQRIHLLWGKEDQIFNIELAKAMTGTLGEKVTFEAIEAAGHLVHIERPCVYNSRLKNYLQYIYGNTNTKNE